MKRRSTRNSELSEEIVRRTTNKGIDGLRLKGSELIISVPFVEV